MILQSKLYQIRLCGSPSVYKLLRCSDVSPDFEEAIFKVHGVIIEKDLPPINIEKYDNQLPHDH